MYDHLIKMDTSSWPRSFLLLQQEAILAKSSMLSGFEFMIKGGFDDVYKGHYYTSFFQLSIGIERMLKLVIISDHMYKNDYQPPDIKTIKSYGHDLLALYQKAKEISEAYSNSIFPVLDDDSIHKNILVFMNDFAAATGRYHNISNIAQVINPDPLTQWWNIIDQIKCHDFSNRTHSWIENEVAKRLNPQLQLQDIVENTGYVSDMHKYVMVDKANYYAVWNTLELIKPIIKLLSSISWRAHERDTTEHPPKYRSPHIPYYEEIFPILYTSKADALRRKRWTDLGL